MTRSSSPRPGRRRRHRPSLCQGPGRQHHRPLGRHGRYPPGGGQGRSRNDGLRGLHVRTRIWSSKAGVDAVIVCTPPATHTEIALHFLEQRHPRAVREAAVARRRGRQGRSSMQRKRRASFWRWPRSSATSTTSSAPSRSIASGVLGDILLFENAFTAKVDMSKRWNSDPKVSGGGVLIDNGTHSVDIVRYLLGPIAEVLAVEGKRVAERRGRGHRQPVPAHRDAASRPRRSVVEHQQGAGHLPAHLRHQRHHPRRLAGVEVPPVVQPGLGGLRQRLRQGPGVRAGRLPTSATACWAASRC